MPNGAKLQPDYTWIPASRGQDETDLKRGGTVMLEVCDSQTLANAEPGETSEGAGGAGCDGGEEKGEGHGREVGVMAVTWRSLQLSLEPSLTMTDMNGRRVSRRGNEKSCQASGCGRQS